jgi:serine/threonine protein kinase
MISEKQIMETISCKQHPFIVNMLTSFQDERKLYIVLEYVPGGEFFSYLRNAECFDADTARFYAASVTEVFGYLHAMDVIYRDLKPEVRMSFRKNYVA